MQFLFWFWGMRKLEIRQEQDIRHSQFNKPNSCLQKAIHYMTPSASLPSSPSIKQGGENLDGMEVMISLLVYYSPAFEPSKVHTQTLDIIA
jgi:hypothetical protein